MSFDREFAMQYVSDNSKVIYNQRLDYQYITSMDNKTLEFYMRIIKSFIRDFPDDFKEV